MLISRKSHRLWSQRSNEVSLYEFTNNSFLAVTIFFILYYLSPILWFVYIQKWFNEFNYKIYYNNNKKSNKSNMQKQLNIYINELKVNKPLGRWFRIRVCIIVFPFNFLFIWIFLMILSKEGFIVDIHNEKLAKCTRKFLVFLVQKNLFN